MNVLLIRLGKVVSDEKARKTVLKRIEEFGETGSSRKMGFSELCFCILTANYSAEGGWKHPLSTSPIVPCNL